MRCTSLLVLLVTVVLVASRGGFGGGGRGFSGGRAASSSVGRSSSSSFSTGSSASHGSIPHATGGIGASMSAPRRPTYTSPSVSRSSFGTSMFTAFAVSSMFHHTISPFSHRYVYVTENPSAPIKAGPTQREYYFGLEHLPGKNCSQFNVTESETEELIHATLVTMNDTCNRECSAEIDYNSSDPLTQIEFPNGQRPSHVAWRCEVGEKCCDFDCCRQLPDDDEIQWFAPGVYEIAGNSYMPRGYVPSLIHHELPMWLMICLVIGGIIGLLIMAKIISCAHRRCRRRKCCGRQAAEGMRPTARPPLPVPAVPAPTIPSAPPEPYATRLAPSTTKERPASAVSVSGITPRFIAKGQKNLYGE